jgi:hypothetical protein
MMSMDSDLLILACVVVVSLAIMGSVYLYMSAKVRMKEADTERAAIYAGKARMETEAELAALSLSSNQPQGEQDIMSFLLQIAQSNPELVQKLVSGLGQQNQQGVQNNG